MIWEENRDGVKEKWKKWWNEYHTEEISNYTWNYLFTGGKEIRARLFCELWSYLSPDLKVNAELAFAIECIHAASLILDDTPWMDNADERRGRKTLHLVYTPKKAVLVAFEVMHMVMEIWLSNRPEYISEEVWATHLKLKLEKLIQGQWYDLEKKGTLYELASFKTGVLFELVTETVALCVGLDRDYWRFWGNSLGVLFQWTDDWNDREEDMKQKNRNAFNEDAGETSKMYNKLWSVIEYGIGKQWFEKPFGQFMKKYFRDSHEFTFVTEKYALQDLQRFTLSLEANLEGAVQSDYKNMIRFVSNATNINLFDFESSQTLIMRMYNFINTQWFSHYTKSKILLKSNLWEVDETEWDTFITRPTMTEVVRELITQVLLTYSSQEAFVIYTFIKTDILYSLHHKKDKAPIDIQLEEYFTEINEHLEEIIDLLAVSNKENKDKIEQIGKIIMEIPVPTFISTIKD